MSGPIHIRPTAPLAERVLLPDDPGTALALAQALLEQPKMFNHQWGLWGYTGAAAADGRALTIQSTGIGGPSAAIVVSELAQLGAGRLIRVGTCRALSAATAPGEPLIATSAICADGTSRALTDRAADPERVDPAPELLAGLRAAGAGRSAGVVVSTDLFYDRSADELARWSRLGADVVELETATVFALARRRGLRAAAVLLVTAASGASPDPESLQAGLRRVGEIAAAALSA